MGKRCKGPAYPLEWAKKLVSEGSIRFTKRGRAFIQNNYDNLDFEEVSLGVFESISEEHYLKTDELEKRPGTYADIYKGMVYDDIEWYVKFYVDGDGYAQVMVWSMCWDGAGH